MDPKNINRNEKILKSTEKAPKEASTGFFQLTKQQLSVDISKYDKAIAKNTLTFNSKPASFSKRLNSMDSTMLEETAYNILDDNELKLEKRIEKILENLKQVSEKIIVAETVKDVATLDELNLQKMILEKNLESVQNEYRSKNIDTKFTSIMVKISEFPKKLHKRLIKKFRSFLRHSKILRKCTPLMRSIAVRDTIGRLDKINKSVDELVKMQVPFGEQEARYKTLVNYLSRAGSLHSQIIKELKG